MCLVKECHYCIYILLSWMCFISEIPIVAHSHHKVYFAAVFSKISNVVIDSIEIHARKCHVESATVIAHHDEIKSSS